MKKKELRIDASPYETPAIKVLSLLIQKCIATSVTGSTEGFTNESQTEGFNEVDKGDF